MHHHAHLNELTAIQTYILIALSLVVLYIYFLPTVTAIRRNSPHKIAVIFLNLFFGVTLIGWIFALLLASKQPQQVVVVVYNTPPPSR